MIKLAHYLKGYVVQSILGPLFKLIEACFELIVPFVMANIIDVGIKNSDKDYIFKMGGVLVLLSFLGLLCSVTAQFFAAKASMGFGTALRRDLYRHVNSLSHLEIDKCTTSGLITRMTNDINSAQSGVNLFLRLFTRSPFIVIGAVVASFKINAKLATIFLLATPLLALVIFGIMHLTIPKYKLAQSKLDKTSLMTREILEGARVIKAFSRQEEEIEQFNSNAEQLLKIQLVSGRISAIMNPATYLIVNIATAFIIWFGGKTVYIGGIEQGDVVALVNFMSQVLLALVALANLIVMMTKAQASSIRILELFDIKSTVAETVSQPIKNAKSENKIEFKNVSFSYNKDSEVALKNINFEVKNGQTVGIIGATGCGKSTLVNMISRFYDATEGEVLVDGVNVKDYPFEQLRNKVGMVLQKAVLFAGTIRDNMRWADENASDETIYKALDIAQAREFVDEKGQGLDFEIAQGGKNLSGGQRQRLTIARALTRKPEILILDDSSSALDFATDAKLRQQIAQNSDNMTVIIVSQRAAGIKSADNIIVLDDGEIVGMGTHQQLLKDCEVYKEICESQGVE